MKWYYPGYIVVGKPKLDYKLFLGKDLAQYYDYETQSWLTYTDDILAEEVYTSSDLNLLHMSMASSEVKDFNARELMLEIENELELIEKNKLISDDIETSPLVIKNTKRLSGSSRKVPEKLTIPSFRYGEDSVYGSYDTLRYNTPYGQWIYNSADMGFGKKVDDPTVS